jgi:glycosyltransferase involved in cell wall biosynthesis
MEIALSIIIPMYNAEKYIDRCLESILQQGLDPNTYEVLVMNDGSTDSSAELVQRYIDKGDPIALHTHKNVGADETRNKGFKFVRGTYVYIMDADDYLAYNCLNTIVERALEDDLEIVAFKAIFTGEEALFEPTQYPSEIPRPEIITGREYLTNNRNTRFETWWYILKRSFLEESGVRFVTDNACSDTYYMLEHFLRAKKIAYYPIEIYRYYDAPTSLTRAKNDGKFIARMFNDFSKTSVGYSEILLDLKKEEGKINPQMWDNLAHRRDCYVFYYISLMIQSKLSKTEIRERLEILREKDAYPIKNFIGPEYNSAKWKLFNYIFNHPNLLLNLAPIYNKFKA